MQKSPRIIVGITGASGAIYGLTLLKALRAAGATTHLIMSKSAAITIKHELNMSLDDIAQHADHSHQFKDVSACISSGSFRSDGMIIAPCTIKTMAEIATCTSNSLLTRAADVILKERRKLVLMVRETPLHAGHLEHMHKLALLGAIIAPPVPAFYSKPTTLQEMVDHTCARVLDLFDIESPALTLNRWQ